MSQTPIRQKLINVIDEFGKGDCEENEAKRDSALKKEPIRVDHLSANYVSYIVSNLVSKNVSKYLTLNTKNAFNQLRQDFTKAPIL